MLQVKGQREESAEEENLGAVGSWESDGGVGWSEFGQHLAAGAAGRAGGVVEVGDGDRGDTEIGAEGGDGSGDGGAFGADGEAVGNIFDVGAGNDGAVCELESGSDAEAGVRRIGHACGLLRGGEERRERSAGTGREIVARVHAD
jgi:hypothetical protein